MVERSLSMREVPGSIPGASNSFLGLVVASEPDCLVSFKHFSIICQNQSIIRNGNWLKKKLQRPGIEPGPPAWQASILPLNQRCCAFHSVWDPCAFANGKLHKGERAKKVTFAVGRIRTYAPRGNLISSQTP